jgi:hypothetical protein
MRVDELRSDPDPVAAPPNAPFEQIAHAELLADVAQIDRATLVGESGIARDDREARELRQCRDNVLDQAVGEELLLRIAVKF